MTVMIPGQGWVFYAPVDTAAPDIADFDPTSPATSFSGWSWLGSTSKDNLVAMSKEGGEVTPKDAWDTPNLRTEKSTETWSMTNNAIAIEQDTLTLAFPNGTWDAQKQMYSLAAKNSIISKALLVVMKDDVSGVGCIYAPNAALSVGDAPTLDAENFFEVPLSATLQTSPTTGSPWGLGTPRPLND